MNIRYYFNSGDDTLSEILQVSCISQEQKFIFIAHLLRTLERILIISSFLYATRPRA